MLYSLFCRRNAGIDEAGSAFCIKEATPRIPRVNKGRWLTNALKTQNGEHALRAFWNKNKGHKGANRLARVNEAASRRQRCERGNGKDCKGRLGEITSEPGWAHATNATPSLKVFGHVIVEGVERESCEEEEALCRQGRRPWGKVENSNLMLLPSLPVVVPFLSLARRNSGNVLE